MAHTTKIGNSTFIHNSDLSGETEIIVDNEKITILNEHLIEFVLRHIANDQISFLENASTKELINYYKKS